MDRESNYMCWYYLRLVGKMQTARFLKEASKSADRLCSHQYASIEDKNNNDKPSEISN